MIRSPRSPKHSSRRIRTATVALLLIFSLFTVSCTDLTAYIPPDPATALVETIPLPDTTAFPDESTAAPDTTVSPDESTAAPETTVSPDESTAAPETTASPDESTAAPPSGKVAYLTFDDGPNKANLGAILDTLDEYGVTATFFTVGTQVEKNPDLVAECYARGHVIGCHSYDHIYARIKEDGGLEAEIAEWETAIAAALGEVPEEKLFRFPGGSPQNDPLDLKGRVAQLGYRGFDWNCANYDSWLSQCPPEMSREDWLKENFSRTFRYGSSLKNAPLIILLHESYVETANMLGWMIEYVQEQGYVFGTLDMLDESWYY